MVNLNTTLILGRALLLVITVGTYVEWHYIDQFSVNKSQNFEGTGRTIWSVLVPSNALKGFHSVPCWREYFLAIKNTWFLINSGHKKAAAIVSDFGRGSFGYGRGDAATTLLC